MCANSSQMFMPNKFSSLALAFWIVFAAAVLGGDAPKVLSRKDWQAEAPTLKMSAQKPVAILVHHTGSPQKPKTSLVSKMRGLQRFSQAKEKLADGRTKPAWPDVPYHFYIAVDGKIAEGRDINAVGDTNTGYDPSGFIQVVVEGNFDNEKMSVPQTAALKSLLQWLMEKHGIEATSIQAHKDKAQTACPGKHLSEKLPGIIAELK
jgi:hypothetical protein